MRTFAFVPNEVVATSVDGSFELDRIWREDPGGTDMDIFADQPLVSRWVVIDDTGDYMPLQFRRNAEERAASMRRNGHRASVLPIVSIG